jgi:hypothetical protein
MQQPLNLRFSFHAATTGQFSQADSPQIIETGLLNKIEDGTGAAMADRTLATGATASSGFGPNDTPDAGSRDLC